MDYALQATISGSYRTSNNEVVDFENVTGLVPCVSENIAIMHIHGRYVFIWIKAALLERIGSSDEEDGIAKPKYPKRVDSIRQIFVDSLHKVRTDAPFSYIGKDIREMNYEELQDLATANDLRTIPLPTEASGVSLREMREKAYHGYSDGVLRIKVDTDDPGYQFGGLPPLLADKTIRNISVPGMTNEQVLTEEEQIEDLNVPHASMQKLPGNLESLKTFATARGIAFNPSIGMDALTAKVQGAIDLTASG